jgi:catechol 2,3-dioxygenase-like lactoylglutathione lyase family enzyme
MITGTRVIVSSRDADADRKFFTEIFGFGSVDAGHGWLIFALPPAEVAVHPTDTTPGHELYLMCDDVVAERERLEALGVPCTEISDARWGSVTRLSLPGGGEVGLYEPRHPSPVMNRAT